MVWPPINNLWGSVQRAAAKGLKILITMVEVRQAEVGDLQDQVDTILSLVDASFSDYCNIPKISTCITNPSSITHNTLIRQ